MRPTAGTVLRGGNGTFPDGHAAVTRGIPTVMAMLGTVALRTRNGLPDPRPTRAAQRIRADPADRRAATRAPRAAPPAPQRGPRQRPADRRALGRGAAADRREGTAERRAPGAPRAGRARRCPADGGRRLRAARRAGGAG